MNHRRFVEGPKLAPSPLSRDELTFSSHLHKTSSLPLSGIEVIRTESVIYSRSGPRSPAVTSLYSKTHSTKSFEKEKN